MSFNKFSIIIHTDNGNKKYSYSIETDIEGYERISETAPIIKVVGKMKIGEKSFNIGGEEFTLMEKDSDIDFLKKRLISKLSYFNKDGFYHETSIENISSIIKNSGIFSREQLEEKNIQYIQISSEEIRKLNKTYFFKMSRFFLRKNSPANYKFLCGTCIFVVDYKIINEDEKFYMTEIIATQNQKLCNINDKSDLEYILDHFEFDKVFQHKFRSDEIEFNYNKKYRSAEFLYPNKLPLKYISIVIFSNKEDEYLYKEMLKHHNIITKVDESYFKRLEGDKYD